MRRRAPSQSTCAEPGSSFCWGPALQGSTSPSSSRSSTLGQADRARCEERQPPTPPPPCARTSHPTCPTHGSRTFRSPCILPTRRLHPRIQPTPSAALVRRSSTLPVEPRCRLAPDAASPPMPPMPPRPDAIPDASFPPFIKHSYNFFQHRKCICAKGQCTINVRRREKSKRVSWLADALELSPSAK